ncbi:hypothetical protein F4779DRAFT_615336 [Xylariaceae sp. FL0662B]|nr:hypothetical protein F4779DRAFT_615336 [Xylariaceae sp. FL0662B]
MASFISRRHDRIVIAAPPSESVAGTISSVILSLGAISILSSFIAWRSLVIKSWRRLPFVVWLVLAIFADSWIFLFSTSIIHYGIGLNSGIGLIYLFLAEKVFIIRGSTKRRLQSSLYLFNSFGILALYVVVCVLSFVYHIAHMEHGQCIIGVKKLALMPLITFDVLVNIYLTALFLKPLRDLYSLNPSSYNPAKPKLRAIAMRTVLGSLGTTTCSAVNLTVLMMLEGELGWVCLMCWNADILFSVLVIQWVTSPDNAGTLSSSSSRRLRPANPASTPYLPRANLAARAFPSLPQRAKRKYDHLADTAETAVPIPAPSPVRARTRESDFTVVPGSTTTVEEAAPWRHSSYSSVSSPSSTAETIGTRNGVDARSGSASSNNTAAAAVANAEEGAAVTIRYAGRAGPARRVRHGGGPRASRARPAQAVGAVGPDSAVRRYPVTLFPPRPGR